MSCWGTVARVLPGEFQSPEPGWGAGGTGAGSKRGGRRKAGRGRRHVDGLAEQGAVEQAECAGDDQEEGPTGAPADQVDGIEQHQQTDEGDPDRAAQGPAQAQVVVGRAVAGKRGAGIEHAPGEEPSAEPDEEAGDEERGRKAAEKMGGGEKEEGSEADEPDGSHGKARDARRGYRGDGCGGRDGSPLAAVERVWIGDGAIGLGGEGRREGLVRGLVGLICDRIGVVAGVRGVRVGVGGPLVRSAGLWGGGLWRHGRCSRLRRGVMVEAGCGALGGCGGIVGDAGKVGCSGPGAAKA